MVNIPFFKNQALYIPSGSLGFLPSTVWLMNTWIFRGWKDETRTSKDWPALSSLAALSRLARRPPTSACGNPWGFFNFERDSLISTWGEDPSPRTWRFSSEDLPPHPDSPDFFFRPPMEWSLQSSAIFGKGVFVKNTKTERRSVFRGTSLRNERWVYWSAEVGKTLRSTPGLFCFPNYWSYLEAQGQPFIKRMFQLDDEPNLCRENGWKSPFPSIYKRVGLGVPGMN